MLWDCGYVGLNKSLLSVANARNVSSLNPSELNRLYRREIDQRLRY
ncbi:hypothetical protein RB4093 [Rhodopirellula baltica SH 1]|uniref:Uncharacterized protein n=1 Tax=Rhodopirellula baltica (strain DSM 10527 / NCIMB 13988 / SH1) TaxID=243090 RepID=Q7UT59_RHOBA|nr:hypothetical protein RB4093 [Rhodopirellula baltica SH 1]